MLLKCGTETETVSQGIGGIRIGTRHKEKCRMILIASELLQCPADDSAALECAYRRNRGLTISVVANRSPAPSANV